jgi:Mg2+ and Co2+ transporter CorA
VVAGIQQTFNLLEVLAAEVAEARVLLQEIQIAINKVFQVLTVWVAVVVAMALVTQQ